MRVMDADKNVIVTYPSPEFEAFVDYRRVLAEMNKSELADKARIAISTLSRRLLRERMLFEDEFDRIVEAFGFASRDEFEDEFWRVCGMPKR